MPQKGNNWIIPLLLALAISAGAIWYYFFRLKPPLESSLPLTNDISQPEIIPDDNPDVSFVIDKDFNINRTVKKYVWDISGNKVEYPLYGGRPIIWGNAVIRGYTEYIPGVPWKPNAPAVLETQQRAK